jgi:hypothetical protein
LLLALAQPAIGGSPPVAGVLSEALNVADQRVTFVEHASSGVTESFVYSRAEKSSCALLTEQNCRTGKIDPFCTGQGGAKAE